MSVCTGRHVHTCSECSACLQTWAHDGVYMMQTCGIFIWENCVLPLYLWLIFFLLCQWCHVRSYCLICCAWSDWGAALCHSCISHHSLFSLNWCILILIICQSCRWDSITAIQTVRGKCHPMTMMMMKIADVKSLRGLMKYLKGELNRSTAIENIQSDVSVCFFFSYVSRYK